MRWSGIVLAFVSAAIEEWVAIRRLRVVLGRNPWRAAGWALMLGAVILTGIGFMKQSNWYAVPLLAGMGVGAWVAVRFR